MKLSEVTSNSWEFIVERVEKQNQGIYVYYQGVQYPRRAYFDRTKDNNYDLRVLSALGNVKKTLFTLIQLKGLVIPISFNIQKYHQFITVLANLIHWNLGEFIDEIKENEYSEPVLEIGKFIKNLLIGIHPDNVISYYKFCMLFLEFDNAYRYFLQDLFGVINREWMIRNPRKEIKRVVGVFLDRNIWRQGEVNFGSRARVLGIAKILTMLLWIPKIKRGFLEAFSQIDLDKVKFNRDDRFHISYWQGYNFEGKTFDERFKEFEDIFKNAPFRKKQDISIIGNFLIGN